MSSQWLLEGWSRVVMISWSGRCFLGVTTSRDPWNCIANRLWSSRKHCLVWLSCRPVRVRVHRNGRLSELIEISPPNCIGCDFDFIGQGSRVACDDSRNPPVYSTVVSGNNSLTYIQLAGRAVAWSQLLVLLFLFHSLPYVGLQDI